MVLKDYPPGGHTPGEPGGHPQAEPSVAQAYRGAASAVPGQVSGNLPVDDALDWRRSLPKDFDISEGEEQDGAKPESESAGFGAAQAAVPPTHPATLPAVLLPALPSTNPAGPPAQSKAEPPHMHPFPACPAPGLASAPLATTPGAPESDGPPSMLHPIDPLLQRQMAIQEVQ